MGVPYVERDGLASSVEVVKRTPIAGFIVPDPRAHHVSGYRAVLKSALRKYRHVEPGDSLDTSPDDFALQRVECRDVVLCERRERNSFRHLDYARSCIGTEALEAVTASWCIRAHVAS